MKSLKVISDISIFEASLVASSGQQGQELLFSEGQECLSLRGGNPSSSPFMAATLGMPRAQLPAAQWAVQNPEAIDDEEEPCVSLW